MKLNQNANCNNHSSTFQVPLWPLYLLWALNKGTPATGPLGIKSSGTPTYPTLG